MSLDALLQAAVEAAVERRIANLQRPLLVHQRNVEQVVGVPRREYLAAARAGSFASVKEKRLVISKTCDVLAYFADRMKVAGAPAATAKPIARGWRRLG